MITIIDYQMGNLRSVQKAFLNVGGRAIVTSDKSKIARSQKVVLPGVGAFRDGMKELKKLGLVSLIKDSINDKKPFFGICLGMQLLFETSEEAPGVKGLGILKGKVKKFHPSLLKVPHMGWNQLKVKGERLRGNGLLLNGIKSAEYVYFVHSYYCEPEDKAVVTATTNYGIDFAAAICKDNIFGCQFHPEKSQDAGLEILKNFVRLC
jgi:glutamine amidotransferase